MTKGTTFGKFQSEGIPLAPRGVPQIGITHDIDANSILHTSAADSPQARPSDHRYQRKGPLAAWRIDRRVLRAYKFCAVENF